MNHIILHDVLTHAVVLFQVTLHQFTIKLDTDGEIEISLVVGVRTHC